MSLTSPQIQWAFQTMEALENIHKGTCAYCHENKSLITHHISYTPEVTRKICRKCHMAIHQHLKGQLQHMKTFKQHLNEAQQYPYAVATSGIGKAPT